MQNQESAIIAICINASSAAKSYQQWRFEYMLLLLYVQFMSADNYHFSKQFIHMTCPR